MRSASAPWVLSRLRPVTVFLLVVATQAAPLALSGCWDLRELEEYVHVGLVGIDQGESPGSLKLTILAIEPGAGSGAQGAAGASGGGAGAAGSALVTASIEGSTLLEAQAKMNRQTNRVITFSHTLAVVFGEDFARSGLSSVIDAMTRSREFRRSLIVLVADTATAEDVLSTVRGTVETSPATYISEVINRNAEDYGVSRMARLHDLLVGYSRLGREIVLPLVRLAPKTPSPQPPEKAGAGEGGAQGGGGGGSGGGSGASGGNGSPGGGQAGGGGDGQVEVPVQKRAEVSGLALFRGDRLAGKADPEQAQGWNLLTGRWFRGFLTIQGEATLGRPALFQLAHYTRRLKVHRQGDRLRLDLEIRVRATAEDVAGTSQVLSPDKNAALSRLLESKIKETALSTLNMAKTVVGADVFDFSLPARRTFSTWYEWQGYDWNRAFRGAEVNLEVKVLSVRPGLSFQPPLPQD